MIYTGLLLSALGCHVKHVLYKWAWEKNSWKNLTLAAGTIIYVHLIKYLINI